MQMCGKLIQEKTFISIRCKYVEGLNSNKQYYIIICLYIVICCHDFSGFAKHFLLSTGFIVYTSFVVILVGVLIFRYVPRYGQTHMVVYIGICSLMGSLTVCLLSYEACTNYNFDSNPCSSDVLLFSFVGYVCESSGDRFEAYIFRNESIYLLPDMVFHCGCGSVLSSADQLLEHGKLSNFHCQGICNRPGNVSAII